MQRKLHAILQGSNILKSINSLVAGTTERYKPNHSCSKQMAQHTTVCKEEYKRLPQNWRTQINLLVIYREYSERFFNTLSESESMWDGHLFIITTAKPRLELVDPTTPSVHPAPYCAGTMVHEFEKTEITKMLENNIIEPAQTKRAAHFGFALIKDGTLRF